MRDTHTKFINQRFGKLLCLEIDKKDKFGHTFYKCLCDCGKEKLVVGYALLSSNTTSCGCSSRKIGEKNKQYKGYKEVPYWFWRQIQRGAKIRNIKFDIKIEDIWNLYLKQDRKCSISGVPIQFCKSTKKRQTMNLSVDRIDSLKSYNINNIQLVHKTINRIKQNLSQEDFFIICNLIANKHPKFIKNIEEILNSYGWARKNVKSKN